MYWKAGSLVGTSLKVATPGAGLTWYFHATIAPAIPIVGPGGASGHTASSRYSLLLLFTVAVKVSSRT